MLNIAKSFQSKARKGAWLAAALLLSACGGSSSDEIAQPQPPDVALSQCQLATGEVVGTPLDNITVSGESVALCLLNTDFAKPTEASAGKLTKISLKQTHRYKPLAWVLDGYYEIGHSRAYNSLEDFQADAFVDVVGNGKLFARPGAVVVVHRNASFSVNSISSEDSNFSGGGEWAGVVVNGPGYHPGCGQGEDFCNIQGPWGYYGGLSESAAQANKAPILASKDKSGVSQTSGFRADVAEAGGPLGAGAPGAGQPLPAAVTINAALLGQNILPRIVLASSGDGLYINGGRLEKGLLIADAQGSPLRLSHGGSITMGVVLHDGSAPAVVVEGGGSAQAPSQVGLTVVDRSRSANTALQVGGGGHVEANNLIVQGFESCLQLADANTNMAISNSVFYCNQPSQAAADGNNYADQALAEASNIYYDNPDLDYKYALGNDSIEGLVPGGVTVNNYFNIGALDLGLFLIYPECFGLGDYTNETWLEDLGGSTVTYNICELSGQVTGSLYLDASIARVNNENGQKTVRTENIAWRIKGEVVFGRDPAGMNADQQLGLLSQGHSLVIDASSRLLLDADSAITVHPGVHFRVEGRVNSPVNLPANSGASWGGIRINGLADSCASSAACEAANQGFVDLRYLKLYQSGQNSQPALSLNELSAADQLEYIDISNASADAVQLSGGATNLRHLLTANVAGDQVSWRNGYRGSLQYAILQAGEATTGHGLHGRNNGNNHNASPRSRPVMANITLVGSESADSGILLEQGSGLLLYKGVVTDYNTCLDIDDPATAALQSAEPPGIYFDEVVLDCAATLAAENEENGADYGQTTQQRSGVYEVAAQLDINFLPSGSDVPGASTITDFSLAGAVADYLDDNAAYLGSVADADDKWFAGWTDAVGLVLAEECDGKGVLEKGYTSYEFVSQYINGKAFYHRVCGLRGFTLSEDTVLSNYTGPDAEAYAAGTTLPNGALPARTIWLLSGVVRVGEGHLELSDPEQVANMKENPVTLTLEAGAIISFAEDAVLHITRGGALNVAGGEFYRLSPEGGNTSGPVNFHGLFDDALSANSDDYVFEPSNDGRTPWGGALVVDGFGRHNQCPDAMAEAGSQVCNIEGEYGYYGGYDNSHNNLQASNLRLKNGVIQLNAVGGGSHLQNLYLEGRGGEERQAPLINIDGGAVHLRNLAFGSSPRSDVESGLLRWHHGYQGSLQYMDIQTRSLSSYGLIQGRSDEPDQSGALPRSQPGLVNISLDVYDRSAADTNNIIDLSQGSGLHLHNSYIGGEYRFYDRGWQEFNCIQLDDSVRPLLGQELIFHQLAVSCARFAADAATQAAVEQAFKVRRLANPEPGASAVSSLNTIAVPSQATDDIYLLDWVRVLFQTELLTDQDNTNNSLVVDGVKIPLGFEKSKYPASALINLGEANSNFGLSPVLEDAGLENTKFFGKANPYIPLNAGYTLKDAR